jgi:DNA-binding NtrC family response regulator
VSERPRILVVDDESAILISLGILFKNEGFEVATAQGGKAGLEALEKNPPDVVLSDIRMPGVSGIDVLSAARKGDPEMPVILMTAQAELRTAIDAVNQGAFGYIQKPFETTALVAACRRAIEHRRLKVENRSLRQEIRPR